MSELEISFPGSIKALQGKINLPASKSISNRVLIIQALCENSFQLNNLSDSTDTKVLLNALQNISKSTSIQTIDVQDAGTSFRFLTAFLSCREKGEYLLKGNERMHKRPIGDLVNALKMIGADISYMEQENFPPLLIKGRKLTGGTISISGNISSQFISALCLIAPVLEKGLDISIQGEAVSHPYIEMTLQLMILFGIQYTFQENHIVIPSQQYIAKDFITENDWSSATFFYAMAMLSESAIFQFDFLDEKSVQGDSYIRDFVGDFGIETIFTNGKTTIRKDKQVIISRISGIYDFNAYPDMAIPMIVACAVKYPEIKFTGLKHLQYKESDRITALTTELKKTNIILQYEDDILSFDNSNYRPSKEVIRFCTYDDHRIAMALSMLALEGYIVLLDNGECVKKSFPGYFEELGKIGFEVD